MDDPLFDPWGTPSDSPPPSTSSGRWRAPDGPPPSPPSASRTDAKAAAQRAAAAARTTTSPRARLAGTPGYMRSMAVPRLQDIAQRLQLARHHATAEDLLDAAVPMARMTFRPWRGPWTEKLDPPVSALELAVVFEPTEQIAVRTWLDVAAEIPTEEVIVPTTKLGAAWLEGIVVDFVHRSLARA